MLKTVLNKRNLIILCILLMFLAIPTAFAEDSSMDGGLSDEGYVAIVDNGPIGDDLTSNGIAEDVSNERYQNTLNIDDNSIINSSDTAYIKTDLKKKGDGSGKTIYVSTEGTDGPAGEGLIDNPYRTPERALVDALDGDSIFLFNGTYAVNNIIINRNVSFIGESQEGTILTGEGLHRIFKVNATDVSFNNLTFINGLANISLDELNGGAISSIAGGYLSIVNCTFLNNRANTHGGAVDVFVNYKSSLDKVGDIHLTVKGSTFIENTAIGMYGGAIHVASTYYNSSNENKRYFDVYANIESSVFINNTGGKEQQHSIAVSSYDSTYFNLSNSVIFADPERIISSEGAYKALVYFGQSGVAGRGNGYANVDGNWWGDNENPMDFNRTGYGATAIDVNNWIIMQASVSKEYVIATLDHIQTSENQILEHDSSTLPTRIAKYTPGEFFDESSIDLIGGVARNEFKGTPPQSITINVDNQNLTVMVESIFEESWFIGDNAYLTLKDAVDAAESGDIIKGIPDIYSPDDISEEIIIDKNISIRKLDGYEGDYILLSSDTSRIFNIAPGVSLNLSNLILENGAELDGGLIYVNSGASLNIANSIFRNAQGAKGGAIYSKGDLTIRDTEFENIQSCDSGGAIYIDGGDLTIFNSSFESVSSAALGGAIYINSSNNLKIDNSSFKNSNAINGGAIYSKASENTINSTVFLEDYAENDYDIIYADANLTVENSIFAESIANEHLDLYVADPIGSLLNKNYWGQNAKPDEGRTNVDIGTWIILKLSIDEDLSLISINSKHNIIVDFSCFTDGQSNYSLDGPIPPFEFKIKSEIGSLNQSSLIFDGQDNQKTLLYTASGELGDELISFEKYSDQNLSFYTRTTVYYYWFIDEIGYETLSEAVEAASDGDTIIGVKSTHLYTESIELNKNLTIKSNSSQARAIFNGEYADGPIFHIAQNNKVDLIDLSFLNGKESAILNDGQLTISGANFTRNGNSAIVNNNELTIDNSAFSNNNGENGGAIFNNNTLSVINSTFKDNSAEKGGAIYNSKNLEIIQSLFLRNNADIGGAIYSENASAGSSADANIIVNYTVFDGNAAETGMAIAGSNLDLNNNYLCSMNYTNLIYDLSSSESVKPRSDFKIIISGPDSLGYGQSANYNIELYSSSGDSSLLPDYELNITTLLDNRINKNSFGINQGMQVLSYQASQSTGDDAIMISGLSGVAAIHNLTVGSVKTHFEFENKTLYYGENDTLIIYLKDESDNVLASFDVVLNFNGEEKEIKTDSAGKVSIDLSNETLKDYSIRTYLGNISFSGASKYLGASSIIKVEIVKIPVNIIAEDLSTYYNDGSSLNISLEDVYNKPLANKTLNIKIKDNEAVLDEFDLKTGGNGKLGLDIDYLPGNYAVEISYGEDGFYDDASKTVNLNVDRMPSKIDADDMEVYCNSTKGLEIGLKDINGKAIDGKEINIIVKKDSTVLLEDNLTTVGGKVNKELDLAIGEYTATISFAGDDCYQGDLKEINLNVTKMATVIIFNTVIIRANEDAYLTAVLKDLNGNPIGEKEISLAILEEASGIKNTFTLISDDAGKIAKRVNLKEGPYNLTYFFAGDDYYNETSLSLSINVLPSNHPYFEANDTLIQLDDNQSIDNESIVILAYLKDGNGQAISGANVLFEIDSLDLAEFETLSYNDMTDSNGKVQIIPILNPGNYDVAISFSDDVIGSATRTISLVIIGENSGDNGTNGTDSNGTDSNGTDSNGTDTNGTAKSTVTTINIDSSNITINETVIITPSVISDGSLIEGTVDILINGIKETTINIGSSYNYVPKTVGTYAISARFIATEEYNASSSAIVILTVNDGSMDNNGTGDNGTDNGTGDNGTDNGTDTDLREIKTSKDLQDLIDKASPGSEIDLGNYRYENISNVNITKDLTITGPNATLTSSGDGNPLFNIPSIANGGPSTVAITDLELKANNGDVLVLAHADNGTSPSSIDVAKIDINGIMVNQANDDVVGESVVLLELNSECGVLAPSNDITVKNNTMISGVTPFKFNVLGFVNGTDLNIDAGGNIASKDSSQIIYNDLTTTAINTAIDGRNGKYFEFTLADSKGNPLSDKAIQIGFNGKIYNRTTNETGGAKLQINLAYVNYYTFAICFLGDDNYNASFVVAKINVTAQKAKLTTSSKTYKASAKTKTLSATFKSSLGNPISGKKISFTVNGKTYTAQTNSKGVASVKVSLSKKGTYSFTAKYAGDKTYAAISTKGTLKLT